MNFEIVLAANRLRMSPTTMLCTNPSGLVAHDHFQEFVANVLPSWMILHNARTTLHPIRKDLDQLITLLRTRSLKAKEGASWGHAKPATSRHCLAPNERLPKPAVLSTTLPSERNPIPFQPGDSTRPSALSANAWLLIVPSIVAKLASTNWAHSPLANAGESVLQLLLRHFTTPWRST